MQTLVFYSLMAEFFCSAQKQADGSSASVAFLEKVDFASTFRLQGSCLEAPRVQRRRKRATHISLNTFPTFRQI